VDKKGFSQYNLDFKPGLFTCTKCDKGCPTCNIVCDLASCIGEFYQTECWCRKDTAVRMKTPLWQLRKYDGQFLANDSVHKLFCNKGCGGGVCDT